jgi:5-bromo-4-chloroindolyl phosphate hydrolysis protein
MARRYGGKYSPGDSNPAGLPRTGPPGPPPGLPPRRSRAGMRANMLFAAPIPLVLIAFGRDPLGLTFNLAAFGILMLAAWLTREGLVAEEAFESRTVARRPAFPRKLVASVLTGIGLFVAAFGADQGVAVSVLLGLFGAGLHSMAFGLDPMKDKGIEGVDSFQTDRVARAVDEAEKHLSAMKDAILRANDRTLERRVDQFQATARAMFRTVEQDPRDLTAARRYLGVYLLGAKDATVKFADLYARTRDQKARADYEALLDDLEKEFAARTEKLLLDDRTNLDIEIEVLRERLEREGVHAKG